MKTVILLSSIFSFAVIANAQTVLINQKGVSLSYDAAFVSTINCDGEKYDKYKVTVYFENNSGHAISIDNSYVTHSSVAERGYGCYTGDATSNFGGYSRIANNYSESKSYYVLRGNGKDLPEPTWLLGAFRFLN